ncbi:MAG: magnesium transporter [Eubacterium sp.]|nr:magnesium transporter [Eubacterium sp.]
MKALTTKEIQELIKENKYKDLKIQLNDEFPMDIAAVLDDLNGNESTLVFKMLSKERAAEVFSYLEKESRSHLTSMLNPLALDTLFGSLAFDDKIDYLEELPANIAKKLIHDSTPENRALINQFLNYPEDSAGSVMTIEYLSLKSGITVGEALSYIRKNGLNKETIYTCYVVSNTKRLLGYITLKTLILADEEKTISELMSDDDGVISVHTTEDREKVAWMFKQYDLLSIPVVDSENRMVGIITVDDIVDIIEDENTEDFQKMAAITPSDESYLKTNIFALAWKRIPWLLVLMISASFTGAIISHFEGLMSSAVALAAFIPMLMSSGGNAGSQSSTLIIRNLAVGDLKTKNALTILLKEFFVGLIAGMTLGAINFLRLIIFSKTDSSIALAVSLTLVLVVTTAKIVGSMLPVAAKALKLDPTIMAGPLITTVLDALSLIFYFSIASVAIL